MMAAGADTEHWSAAGEDRGHGQGQGQAGRLLSPAQTPSPSLSNVSWCVSRYLGVLEKMDKWYMVTCKEQMLFFLC